jgi:integrase
MTLTTLKINGLKAKDKLYQVPDSEGLVLDVHPTGKKVWRYRYRMTGQKNQEKITLGGYPELSLADARMKRLECKKLILQGISPAKHKQQQKTALLESDNLKEFANSWLDKILIPNKKSARHEIAILNNDVYPLLGNRKVQDISQADIFTVLDAIKERGVESRALLARTTLKRVFDYAISRGKMTQNPLALIDSKHIGKVNNRDRALIRAEIMQFIRAVYDSNMTHSNKLALHLLLICMVRKNELLSAQWTEFDFVKGEWTIPANRMKKGKDHTVYLSRQAIAMFAELKALACDDKFVLPSRYKPNQALSQSLLNHCVKQLALPFDFVLHDFRRTASTHLHEAGFNSDVIEKALAHEQRGVRGVYNRSEYASQRTELLQSWADFVDSLRSDNVIVLGNFRKAA